jgi:FAD/FMN-containing dehydrogenase
MSDTDHFTQQLGSEIVHTASDERAFMSQDIWAKGETATVVITPRTVQEMADAIKLAHAKGLNVNPRGGGMSYTRGYTPDRKNVAILDLAKMDQVIAINEQDMTVTVQAGCTWKTLYEALAPKGLRTPFWGPLSGISSTIGGGLSQNNAFFGASLYGGSVESVLSLTVILADGQIVRTGTAGQDDAKPFYRQYGPDLTGLFLGDTGALGFKAEATLRLIPLPEAEDWASFEWDDGAPWSEALAEMGRLGLACELFAFDPNLQRVRMTRASLMSDAGALKNVITKQKGGLLKGLKEGAKVALAGRGFMEEVAYSIHWVVEGHSDAEVAAKMETLRAIAEKHGGRAIENSIPKIIRANPFTPLNNILGPQGERWVPIHGIVSMGDGPACLAEIEAMFATLKPRLDAQEVQYGYLLTTMKNQGYLIEPVFLWPEELFPIHESTVERSTLKRVTRFKSNPDATALVEEARQMILDIFQSYGAAHFQIGRTYRYAQTRSPETLALLEGIKAIVDPQGRVNPGSLGLG